MPFVQIQTNVVVSDSDCSQALLTKVSKALATELSKPESYVMTRLDSASPMTMGGSSEPCCFVHIQNIGSLSPEKTKSMSDSLCSILTDALKIPSNRIYMVFDEVKPQHWGWNRSTFG